MSRVDLLHRAVDWTEDPSKNVPEDWRFEFSDRDDQLILVRPKYRSINVRENGYWEVRAILGSFGKMNTFEEALDEILASFREKHP